MAQFTGLDELNGLAKEVYGESGPVNIIPEAGMLMRKFKLKDAEKQGDSFIQNVVVAHSHGFTYNSTSNTAFDLNDSIAMTTKEASVSAAEIVLRDAISYRAAARTAGGNKKAFRSAVDLVVDNMLESHTKRLEASLLYGGYGIGVASSSTNSSATVTVVTLSEASFAEGIWMGAENAKIEFRVGSNLVSSGSDAVFTITKVDLDNRKLTVSGTATGISALDSDISGAAQDIFWYGAYGQEAYGLEYIMRNTGSLFGIDAATYGLWKSNIYSAGSAQLTMAKVLKGASRANARGLNGKAILAVNPLTWANLASDLSALRKYDNSYSKKKLENGTEAICFYAANGEIEIVGYNMIKRGLAMLIPEKKVKRLGSTEITFNTPGMGGKMFDQLTGKAGFELRNYSDQCIFCETPAQMVLFTDIVNVA